MFFPALKRTKQMDFCPLCLPRLNCFCRCRAIRANRLQIPTCLPRRHWTSGSRRAQSQARRSGLDVHKRSAHAFVDVIVFAIHGYLYIVEGRQPSDQFKGCFITSSIAPDNPMAYRETENPSES